MTDDELHHQLTPLIAGVILSASAFTHLLDRPGMTIEQLRASMPAAAFRRQAELFRKWFTYAKHAMPHERITPEERKALAFWFPDDEENATAEARRALRWEG